MLRRFSRDLTKFDRNQVATLTEQLLLIDSLDTRVGVLDKLQCHSWDYINSPSSQPHRAYSVFVFNPSNQLLLQQRSHNKLTWPMHWSNTVCSHPLSDGPISKVKQEAITRVKFELGFDLLRAIDDLNSFKLLGKVLYKAKYDEIWGEYEVDYIFFVKQAGIIYEAQIAANSSEVNDVKWADQKEVLKALETRKEDFTPWFQRIVKHSEFLKWWDSLDSLKEVTDPVVVALPEN